MDDQVPENKESKTKRDQLKLPVAKHVPVAMAVDAPGIQVEFRKLNEIGDMLWLPASLSEEERNARIIRAIELYEGLKPKGSTEGMLATQMVGTHTMALECLRRAAIEGQGLESRDQNLKHAQKLMSLFAQQMAALDKHRGKGQQKVTVEYVNVEPGAQAIVGNVEAGSGRQASSQTPGTLEKSDEKTVDGILDAGVMQKPANVSRKK